MNIKVYENRLIEFSDSEQGTQNENVIQTINIEIPSIYDDFYKKIVFVTDDGTYWDYIQNDGSYTIENNITKYKQVDFYIWLTKTENEITQDFRSKTYPLFFNENKSPDGEVPEEQETEMERVIRILEEEITKVENLNIEATKVDNVATITITDKDGNRHSVEVYDGEAATDYSTLQNKPQINNVELVGNISPNELGIINDRNFVHIQNVATNVWEINHNLNKYPSVSVMDSSGAEVIGEVKYLDLNNITITFKGGFKGTASLN